MALNKAKKQVVYIHGGQAFNKYEDFIAYLKTVEVRADGVSKRWVNTFKEDLGDSYEVFMPTMPNKQNAKYEEWKIWFERHFQFFRDDIVLIGHSQGGYFLAKYLSENKVPMTVRALYLLAAPAGPDDFNGEDGGDFAFDMAEFSKAVAAIADVYIFHSKDDTVVPFAHAERYQEGCPNAELVSFEGKGHFLMETFPELIESIRASFEEDFIQPSF